MTTKTANIEVGVWDGSAHRLGPIAAAHNLGLIELPAGLVDLARKATAAGDVGGPAKMSTLRHQIKIATGSARTKLEDQQRRDDADRTARHRAGTAVRWAFRDAAASIGADLAAALAEILELARPDVPALGPAFAFGDPFAVARLGEDGQAAAGRLAALAERHDVVRRAAIGLASELELGGGRPATETFNAEAFVGFGARGPARRLRGTASPDYATSWVWKPSGHPVERLAAAALAEPTPADDGDLDDTEAEVATA